MNSFPRRSVTAFLLLTVITCLLIPTIATAQKAKPQPVKPIDGVTFFTKTIKPILDKNCISCHTGKSASGGLDLTSRETFLKGGLSGDVLSLKAPAKSLFIKAVNYDGLKMPPTGRLPQPQVEALTKWIKMGAPWSGKKSAEPTTHEAPKVTPETMKFWSFQPVKRPIVPKVKQKTWVRNPIDAFVLSRLEKIGLTPNPTASKLVLIRRATYDLTGLPPTPDEVRDFLNDKSPNAYEKLIDRLLESPHYGERWGRHWLDLVRYAETNSYERDGDKPFVWRYRDYVINALNNDLPYDQFVMEQLAGDELPERTPQRLIATGYYRLGIWDDEPADPLQAHYDDLDDIVSTTGQVFMGMTIGCARCHDHKIDPMPQKDYYKMLAFFSGVKRYGVRSNESVEANSLSPISSPEKIAQHKTAVAEHQQKLRTNRDELTKLEELARPDFQPVEKEEFNNPNARIEIMKKRVGKILTQEQFNKYVTLSTERRRLERSRPPALEMALTVKEEQNPPSTKVLMRGNPHTPGEEVKPGFLAVLNNPDPVLAASNQPETLGRRLTLAKWIASPTNPLTARVMVNRIWQYHFGRGIVRTSSNFGFQGTPPTHPDLLDWLASDFTTNGWKMKRVHKLMMTSSTYRMSSVPNPAAVKKDPENDLYWRFDMRRLFAEEVRDSILAVNSSLNRQMYGPSIFPKIPAMVLAGQSRPGEGWYTSAPEQQRRRSVYIHVKRSLTYPLIASFDGPETDFSCPIRFATTQPTQALGMMNSEFINEEARTFAADLKKQAGENTEAQVRLGLLRVLQREPTQKEIARGIKLINDLVNVHKLDADKALTSFCVVAFNLNEFIYLE